MAHLVADALSDHDLIPDTPGTGSLQSDLQVLLDPFTAPLSTPETVAAVIIGPSRHNLVLAGALFSTVVTPLSTTVHDILRASTERGGSHPPAQSQLMATVVLALWWDRYITPGPVLSSAEVDLRVRKTLLPIVK